MTILSTYPPSTLDPAKVATSPLPYMFEIYDRLTQLDSKGNIVPMIATKWAFSANGLALTMDLRRDVKFNDGTPMIADDVKASIERAQTVPGTVQRDFLSPISSITVVNPYQVRLNLSRPAGDLPAVLASGAGAVINRKAIKQGRNLATNPGRGAGSGARVLQRFIPNDRATFVRADNDYWDPKANNFAKVTLIRSAEWSTRLNAFRTGQANVVMVRNFDLPQAREQGRRSGNQLAITKEYATQYGILINPRRNNFNRLEVRQALNYGLDREAIAKFMDGSCDAATQMYFKGEAGYARYLDNGYNYDPAKARRLLRSVGLDNELSFTLAFPAGISPQLELVQVVKEQYEKIGIRVKISAPDAASITPSYQQGNVDALMQNMPGDPDPAIRVTRYLTGGYNQSTGVAPEIAGLNTEGKNRTVPARQWQQKYRDIAGIVQNKALYVPVCNTPSMWLAKGNVQGLTDMPWQTNFFFDTRHLAITR